MNVVASVMAALVDFAIGTILEIDEMSYEELPDGKVKVTFVTTGVLPDTCKIKTMIWALVGFPVQKVDEIEIIELQKGPVFKRYRVTAVLTPALRSVKKGEGLGILDILTGENVKYIPRND